MLRLHVIAYFDLDLSHRLSGWPATIDLLAFHGRRANLVYVNIEINERSYRQLRYFCRKTVPVVSSERLAPTTDEEIEESSGI